MALVQYIYTSMLKAEMTAINAFQESVNSVKICQQLGISGRVFANRLQALAITEGPEEIVARYYDAVRQDPLASNMLLHVKRSIVTREFIDYSIWLNLGQPFEANEHIRVLTRDSLKEAWPENLSLKVRIMADAYLDGDMLSA